MAFFSPLPHTLFGSVMWADLLKILQVSRWKQNLICCLQLKPISNVNRTALACITKKAWDIVFKATWCTPRYLVFLCVNFSLTQVWWKRVVSFLNFQLACDNQSINFSHKVTLNLLFPIHWERRDFCESVWDAVPEKKFKITQMEPF